MLQMKMKGKDGGISLWLSRTKNDRITEYENAQVKDQMRAIPFID